MEYNKIKEIIIRIRNVLNFWDQKIFEVDYKQVLKFKEKNNYPIDFQIFMEEIGELDIGNGYTIFVSDTPFCLKTEKKVDRWRRVDVNTKLYEVWPETHGDADNRRLFANDDSAGIWTYDTKTVPYKLVLYASPQDFDENDENLVIKERKNIKLYGGFFNFVFTEYILSRIDYILPQNFNKKVSEDIISQTKIFIKNGHSFKTLELFYYDILIKNFKTIHNLYNKIETAGINLGSIKSGEQSKNLFFCEPFIFLISKNKKIIKNIELLESNHITQILKKNNLIEKSREVVRSKCSFYGY